MSKLLPLIGTATAALLIAGTGISAVAPLVVVVQSQTKTTVTLAWTPPPGAEGYVFKVDGNLVSSTANGGRATVRFALGNCSSPNSCTVRALAGSAEGSVSIGAAPPPPPQTGQVTLSPAGNDSTCSRNGTACATFDRAYQLAQAGDTVSVAGGVYPQSTASSPESDRPGTMILPSSKSGTVTFACAASALVTFSAPGFALYPGVSGVAFVGGCFHFNTVALGFGGYASPASNITFDGVQMSSFECNGCVNLTIRNSTIGPLISCWDTGHGAANCDPTDTAYGEDYWAKNGGWKSTYSTVGFAHYGNAGLVRNLVLDHDIFAGFNTRDSQNLHIECLFLWGFQGATITNSTFSNCATFDLYMSTEVTSSGLTMTGNTFAAPVWDLDEPGGTLAGTERAKDWRDLTVFTKAESPMTNWLIKGNTFSHGISLDPNGAGPSVFQNVAVTGNNLGSNTVCTAGVTFSGNTSCG